MMVYLYEYPKAFLARMQGTQGETGEQARVDAEAEERARAEADARMRG